MQRIMRLAGAAFIVALALAIMPAPASGQGVAGSSMNVTVNDASHAAVAGASVTAVHVPSGTTYRGITRADGRLAIPGMRVGGPYRLSIAAIGFAPQTRDEIYLSLGVAADIAITANRTAVTVAEMVVKGEKDAVFSSDRTGAATTVPADVFVALPTIGRGLDNFTRLSPLASGTSTSGTAASGVSFVGQDNRINNITVDGTYINNSFGLGSAPGARTNVSAISLDAIQEVQLNVAPFDVRQSNFVGAGVNTVTKSGTNKFAGSFSYRGRNQDLVGTHAGDLAYNPGTFSFHQIGGTLGGPIIPNKLFFFGSYETDKNSAPATSYVANTGGQPVVGNVTRVLASDLDAISTYMASNFNYQTGAYQGYNFLVPSKRFLGKLDLNINDHNKVSLRYSMLNSSTDVLESNSNSAGGLGNRNSRSDAMSFQNSNYKIKENNRSLALNLTSTIGVNKANEFTVGYFKSDESRDSLTGTFPLIDIQQGGATYTSLGFEPFTPGNQLRYHSLQIQDNFTIYLKKHEVNIGATYEKYHSDNVFYPESQSVYIYKSLADFYTDLNGYLANPTRTTSPVTLAEFQVRYNNIPGQVEPLQPLQVASSGAYIQDHFGIGRNVKVTVGLRADLHSFDNTALTNPIANAMSFRDNNGATVQYQTQQLPKTTPLWSPRLGFNWNVNGTRETQVRGGTGVFTGSPPYVWISNQVGQNGILTGLVRATNTTAYPFNPNPNAYKPTTVTGAPASSYELDFTSANFKFSQLWRTDLAIDQKLPWGVTGTVEYVYNRDVNAPIYFNANLPAPIGNFTGIDARPRYSLTSSAPKLNSSITAAYVIGNSSAGHSWMGAASLEKAFKGGLYIKTGYSNGKAYSAFDPGSVASGSWTSNAQAGDPNNPALGISSNSPGQRFFVAVSKRLEYFKMGATTVSLYYNANTIGNASYTFSGDLNADGSSSNDLIYIPKDVSEMNFKSLTVNTVTFTPAQQAAAWDAVIIQDPYLSKHRGGYAERGGVFLPMVKRADLSVVQEVFGKVRGTNSSLEFRLDILNVGNLINKNWGLGRTFVTTQPLVSGGADANGAVTYTLKTTGTTPTTTALITTLMQQTASVADVYRLQLGGTWRFF